MTRDEVISLADEWLKSAPDLKNHIKIIDVALKKETYGMSTIEKLKKERYRLDFKLAKVIKAVGTLDDENQKIICFRYFDKLSYSEIVKRVGLSSSTIQRRINKLLLQVGRITFGFEDEFWREIDK